MLQTHLFLISIGMVLIVSSCTGFRKTPIEVKRPKSLRWVIDSQPTTLNWNECKEITCRKITTLMVEGLTQVKIRQDNLEVIPCLAQEWVLRPNRLTFRIKRNVFWSDGSELVSHQFVDSWRNLLRQRSSIEIAPLLTIFNAKEYHESKVSFDKVGIRTPDPYTIEIELIRATPNLLYFLAHPSTGPLPNEPLKNPTVIGPFVPRSMHPEKLMHFVRNEKYHGKLPDLNGIDVLVENSPFSRLQYFLNEEVHLVDDAPHEVVQLLANPSLVKRYPTFNLVGIAINPYKRPLHQLDIRQHLARLIDRSEIQKITGWPIFPTDNIVPTSAIFAPPKMNPVSQQDIRNIFPEIAPVVSPSIAHAWHRHPPGDTTRHDKELLENIRAQWSKKIPTESPTKPGLVASTPGVSAPSFALVDCPINPILHLFGISCIKEAIPWEVKALTFFIEGAKNIWQPADQVALLKQTEQSLVQKEALLIPLFFRGKYMLVSSKVHQLDYSGIETLDLRNTVIQ